MAACGHAQGSVALSLCTTAHSLHTRFAKVCGASIPEATMRPNPRHAPGAPEPPAGGRRDKMALEIEETPEDIRRRMHDQSQSAEVLTSHRRQHHFENCPGVLSCPIDYRRPQALMSPINELIRIDIMSP